MTTCVDGQHQLELAADVRRRMLGSLRNFAAHNQATLIVRPCLPVPWARDGRRLHG